ncbi:MAG: DUF4124 domain-containing protein, partial [Gammaproteobacteria bacterium]|nr:DUF4124 domain-containing protein [Gammaproteobacteria bacterium]
MNKLIPIVIFSLVQLWTSPLIADVYKYQDKYGKWHFTDKPPKDKNNSAVAATVSTQSVKTDLRDDLHQAFNPASKVDEASLSVVTVQTSAG